MLGEGRVTELQLLDEDAAAWLACPAALIPAAGQYTLAHTGDLAAPLATVLFAARTFPNGFLTAPPIPSRWAPGTALHLRGPLGQGFVLPPGARRVALVAHGCSARRLLALLEPAFRQGASVVLVSGETPDDLPLQVEAQPPGALLDAYRWADYVAFDVARESLPELKAEFQADRSLLRVEAQALVRTRMPCGALAACGVCTVEAGRQQLLACEDGPVFDFRQLMGWSSRA